MMDLEKEAIEFMKVNGHEVGNGDLVAQADEVAFDLAIEEVLVILEGIGWIEFCGDDYCEDCKGWDGKSNRCDCGNRRVCWANLDCNFKNMQIYAEAH